MFRLSVAMCLAFAVALAAPVVAQEEPYYDEFADSPTVYLEGCGRFPAVRILIEGEQAENRAFIRNGRTYLAARETLERLGGQVVWEQEERAFYASFPERATTIRVGVDSGIVRQYTYDAAAPNRAGDLRGTVRLAVEPFQCEGVVFIPVRAAAEAAGATVRYDKENRVVHVDVPEGAGVMGG